MLTLSLLAHHLFQVVVQAKSSAWPNAPRLDRRALACRKAQRGPDRGIEKGSLRGLCESDHAKRVMVTGRPRKMRAAGIIAAATRPVGRQWRSANKSHATGLWSRARHHPKARARRSRRGAFGQADDFACTTTWKR
jgi:hypothetical protein